MSSKGRTIGEIRNYATMSQLHSKAARSQSPLWHHALAPRSDIAFDEPSIRIAVNDDEDFSVVRTAAGLPHGAVHEGTTKSTNRNNFKGRIRNHDKGEHYPDMLWQHEQHEHYEKVNDGTFFEAIGRQAASFLYGELSPSRSLDDGSAKCASSPSWRGWPR